MEENNREVFRFLFKLFILIQLYSYLKSTTEATQISSTKENDGQFHQSDGENLNDRMSQIEAKSRRQENDISFLKAIIVEDKRTIRQLRCRVSSLESLMLTKNSETNGRPLLRQKRPYRLLPAHPSGDKMKKEKAAVEPQFYGPASNCNELGKLGYTLNGYYLVKGKGELTSNSIEAVLCQFNLPEESKGGTIEERLGFVTISKNVEKPKAPSKENPIELAGTQRSTNKNELKATEINLNGLMSSIDSTTTAKPSAGGSILHGITRRAKLINGFGKCVGEDSDSYLYQWDCDSSNVAMLWSWNQVSLGSKDRHICDRNGFCAASHSNLNNSIHLFAWYHLDEQGQRFNFVDSPTHPGFYVIKNDHGKCLSVKGNTNQTGAQIWVDDCIPLKSGQRWKWHN